MNVLMNVADIAPPFASTKRSPMQRLALPVALGCMRGHLPAWRPRRGSPEARKPSGPRRLLLPPVKGKATQARLAPRAAGAEVAVIVGVPAVAVAVAVAAAVA